MEKPVRTLALSDDFVLLEETRPFEKLSDDVMVEVLSWLEPKDLAKMARLSQYFNGILRDKSFRNFHRMKVQVVETRMASFREELASAAKVPSAFSKGGEVVGTIASAVAGVFLLRSGVLLPTAASAGGFAGKMAGQGLGRLWVDSFYTRWIEKKKHPLFREDDTAQRCRRCSVAFSMTTWRQHCRACGSAVCSACLTHEERIPEIGYTDVLARVCTICFDELQLPCRRVVLVGPEARGLITTGQCTKLAAEEGVFQHMYRCLTCDVHVCATCIGRCHAAHRTEQSSEFGSAICACSVMGICKGLDVPATEEAHIEHHTREAAAEEEERFARLGQARFSREEVAQLEDGELLALFSAFDMDGNGCITAEDWRAWKQHNLPAILLSEALLARDDRFFECTAPHGVTTANFRLFLDMLSSMLEK